MNTDATRLEELADKLEEGVRWLPRTGNFRHPRNIYGFDDIQRRAAHAALRSVGEALEDHQRGAGDPGRIRRLTGLVERNLTVVDKWRFQGDVTTRHAWVRVDEVCIDGRVHLDDFDEARCQHIIDNFDPNKFKRIRVIETATRHTRACACDQNHPYVCLGGRHRITASRRLGYDAWEVLALVLDGLHSHEDERRSIMLLCSRTEYHPTITIPDPPPGPGTRPPASEKAAVTEGGTDSRAALEGGTQGGA